MYTCPMHPDIQQAFPGNCPQCGMALVPEGAANTHAVTPRRFKDFLPLIVIFSIIIAFTFVRLGFAERVVATEVTSDFMAGFFLVFGLFKVLNWRGFVDAYQGYDLIAKQSRAYGYLYPFLELGLGIAYLVRFAPVPVNFVTFILMSVSGVGVFQGIRKKEQIPCACLGVVFKIPMTWVTFIEDALMAVMALAMLSLRAVTF